MQVLEKNNVPSVVREMIGTLALESHKGARSLNVSTYHLPIDWELAENTK